MGKLKLPSTRSKRLQKPQPEKMPNNIPGGGKNPSEYLEKLFIGLNDFLFNFPCELVVRFLPHTYSIEVLSKCESTSILMDPRGVHLT